MDINKSEINLSEFENNINWSKTYNGLIKRNIGLINFSEQEKIRNTTIIIFGIGGLGGPLAEQLVRSGCERIIICDDDIFQESNLNRQICTREDIGKLKVDITKNYLKKINPEIKIQKYYEINESNIFEMLEKPAIAILTLDDPIASIIISRACVEKKIPMIESWGIPYLWAWWFTSESIDYETCYNFNTQGIPIKEIKKTHKSLLNFKERVLIRLMQFPGIKETYNRIQNTIEGMISGEIALVSLAPIVRITASYLAFEVIFSGILKTKKMVLAPIVIGYDYFRMKPIKFNFLRNIKKSNKITKEI